MLTSQVYLYKMDHNPITIHLNEMFVESYLDIFEKISIGEFLDMTKDTYEELMVNVYSNFMILTEYTDDDTETMFSSNPCLYDYLKDKIYNHFDKRGEEWRNYHSYVKVLNTYREIIGDKIKEGYGYENKNKKMAEYIKNN